MVASGLSKVKDAIQSLIRPNISWYGLDSLRTVF